MAKRESLQKAKNKYDRKMLKITVRFNPNDERELEMANYLEDVDSKAGELKDALYEYMNNHNLLKNKKEKTDGAE